MAYKLLVVDDEYMILEGMKRLLPYHEYGIEVVYTAESADEALACFEKETIDIVLTDVSMPAVSGLEMIEQMQHIQSGTSFIIMSGYQEFRYAQKALSLGALDYLVKPVNKQELARLLQRIIGQKNQQNQREKQEKWLAVLKGQTSPVTIVEGDGPLYFFASEEILPGAVSLEKQLCGKTIYLQLVSKKPSTNGLLLEQLNEASSLHCFVERIEQRLFYETISTHSSTSTEEAYAILQPIFATGNLSRLAEQLPLACDLLRKQTPSVSLTKHFFVQLMTEVYHEFQQLQRSSLAAFVLQIEESRSLTEASGFTLEHLAMLRDKYRYSNHVRDSLAIVHEEYANELTLKDVSERLFLNTVYLGQLIKKETGSTFAELLNQQRIKIARQLLVTSQQGVEEICFAVGYTNIGYFYKIFKRYCGESPKSYRQKMGYFHQEEKEE